MLFRRECFRQLQVAAILAVHAVSECILQAYSRNAQRKFDTDRRGEHPFPQPCLVMTIPAQTCHQDSLEASPAILAERNIYRGWYLDVYSRDQTAGLQLSV